MYPQFFGFDKLPFRLRPDPAMLYPAPGYLAARSELLAGLRGGARLILLLGAPGAGKTLLLEDLLAEIAREYALCRINQPNVSATEMQQAVLMQLGAPGEGEDMPRPRSSGELSAALDAAAARHPAALIVVDDAQLLAPGTLNAFSQVLARTPRLAMLLVGRQDPRCTGGRLSTANSSIGETREVRLEPFSKEESKAYVEHRLKLAGGGPDLFTEEAYATIFQHAAGTARLINVLCDAALHAACLRTAGHVSAAEILTATLGSRWPEALARDRPEAASSPDGRQRPYAELVVMHQAERVAAFPLAAGRISIGRAVDNELHLDARYVSRYHCEVVTVGNVSTIADLGSVNGLLINGRMVKRHTLAHGDEIAVGEHVLKYLVS